MPRSTVTKAIYALVGSERQGRKHGHESDRVRSRGSVMSSNTHHHRVAWWVRHLWHHFALSPSEADEIDAAPSHRVLTSGICCILLTASATVVWAVTRNPFGPPFVCFAALGTILLLWFGITMHDQEPECSVGSQSGA